MANGVLYGIASGGGNLQCYSGFEGFGCGTFFEIKRSGSHFVEQTLYEFENGGDGYGPNNLIRQGNVFYGTTANGGKNPECDWYNAPYYCGTVFRIQPHESGAHDHVLHRFNVLKSSQPVTGFVMDAHGAFYGTTYFGNGGNGTIFKLSPRGQGYTLATIHTFKSVDGRYPVGLVLDQGVLYGVTSGGGSRSCRGTPGCGTLFKLSPNGSTYKETMLHWFRNVKGDGAFPQGGLIVAKDGNIYGTTAMGGSGPSTKGYGTVFRFSPSDGTYQVLYSFQGLSQGNGPMTLVSINGNIYGTTQYGGSFYGPACAFAGCGTLFKLTHNGTGFAFSLLHTFGFLEGRNPYALIVSGGMLYGTAVTGGGSNCPGDRDGCGVVYEAQP